VFYGLQFIIEQENIYHRILFQASVLYWYNGLSACFAVGDSGPQQQNYLEKSIGIGLAGLH